METVVNSIRTASYFFAGKSIFTVSNDVGIHHTFKIKASKDGKCFFVSKLTKPEYYSFMGTIFDKTNPVVRVSRKSKLPLNHIAFAVFEWSLSQVILGKELPVGYSIQHNGHCGRCGRVLTDPESIAYGIGPVCRDYENVDPY